MRKEVNFHMNLGYISVKSSIHLPMHWNEVVKGYSYLYDYN